MPIITINNTYEKHIDYKHAKKKPRESALVNPCFLLAQSHRQGNRIFLFIVSKDARGLDGHDMLVEWIVRLQLLLEVILDPPAHHDARDLDERDFIW